MVMSKMIMWYTSPHSWFPYVRLCPNLNDKLMTVCSFHVMYAFQSESTIYSCLNVKELLAPSRREIWRLSDCNWTRTQNHLVRKQTLNHLAKLACVWLSVCLQTKWFWVRVRLQSLIDEVLSINPSAVCLCRL